MAVLNLELDADAEPAASDLLLATRDGELVWRGQACTDAWQAGLRLRDRWRGEWTDALWAMSLAVLDAELASHGLRREGQPTVDVVPEPAGFCTRLAVRAPVIPSPADDVGPLLGAATVARPMT